LTFPQNRCNIRNIKRDFDFDDVWITYKDFEMSGCNKTIVGVALNIVLTIVAVAMVMLAGCMFANRTGSGHGSAQAAKEAGMNEQAEAGAAAESHLPSGKAAYSDVDELEVSVTNGTLTCRLAEMAPGEVAFEWTYHNGTGGKAHADNYELRHKLSGHRLVITDWRDAHKNWLGHNSARLDLTVRHGPDVTISEANLGNGDLVADGVITGGLNVGNGTMQLSGELAPDADLNVGNGDIKADLLVRAGDHTVNVGNGSIALKFRPQTSLALSASVAVGAINAPPEIAVTRSHLVGASANGSLGDGAAALSLNIGNGNIELKPGDSAPQSRQYGRRLGIDIWKPGSATVMGLLGCGAVLTTLIK